MKKAPKTTKKATTTTTGWQIGQSYFVRTVTHHVLGRLDAVDDHELWMSDVSWIADDGRFHEFLRDGRAGEVEPAPAGPVAVGRGAIIDAYVWQHELLRDVV